jgi:zinc-ribbon domain
MSVVSLSLLVWVVIGSIILLPVATIAARVSVPGSGIVLLIWFLVTIVPLLGRVAQWRGRFFALTDQRILSGHGVAGKSVDAVTIRRTTGLLDVQTARVTEVEMNIPFAGRIFGYGNIHFISSTIPIDPWNGIKRPTEVRRFVEETLGRNQEVAGQQLAYGDAATRAVAGIAAQQRMGFLPQQAPYPAVTAATPQSNLPKSQAASLPTPPAEQTPVGYCAKCGTRYALGTKFCPECGTPVSASRDKAAEEIAA